MDPNEQGDDVESTQNWILDTEDDYDSLAMLEINRSIQRKYERALLTGNLNSESESDFDEDEEEDDCCSNLDGDEKVGEALNSSNDDHDKSQEVEENK